MKRWIPAARGEAGLAFPLAMIVTVVLSTTLLAFLAVALNEPQMGRAHEDVTQALGLAHAGVEAALDELLWDQNWTGRLGRTWSWLIQPTPLPERTTAFGTYEVKIRNDCFAGDHLTTGEEEDQQCDQDRNGVVLIQSTGRKGTAVRTLQVVFAKAQPPIPECALCFTGTKASTYYGVNAHKHHDGTDNTEDGDPGSAASVAGIMARNGRWRDAIWEQLKARYSGDAVDEFFDDGRPDHFGHGSQEIDGQSWRTRRNALRWHDEGREVIWSQEDHIPPARRVTSSQIENFIRKVRASADVTESIPPAGRTFRDIGRSCANWRLPSCWGTSQRYKIVFLEGTGNPAPTVTFADDFDVYALLVVHNARVAFSGSAPAGKHSRFRGLLVTSGIGTGIEIRLGNELITYGVVDVNETGPETGPGDQLMIAPTGHDGPDEYDGCIPRSGCVRGFSPNQILAEPGPWQFTGFYRCKECLNKVRRLRGLVRAYAWREVIP